MRRLAVLGLVLACLATPAWAQISPPLQTGLGLGAQRVLCSIRGVNMNTTADQTCNLPSTISAWAPTAAWTTNCSGTLTLAAGGVYPAASKAGTPLVAAAQAYSTLTTSALILPLTFAANIVTNRYTISAVFFSLTTGAGSAATCDFYVIGVDLS